MLLDTTDPTRSSRFRRTFDLITTIQEQQVTVGKTVPMFKNISALKKKATEGLKASKAAQPPIAPAPAKVVDPWVTDTGSETSGKAELHVSHDNEEELHELRARVDDLMSENRRLEQDMEDQKLAFEDRHASIMAVLAQQPPPSVPTDQGNNDAHSHADQSELDSVRKALVKSEEEASDSKALLLEARVRLDRLTQAHEELSISSKSMEAEIDQKRTECTVLQEQCDHLQATTETQSRKIEELELMTNRMQQTMNERSDESAQTISTLKRKVDSLNTELSAVRERADRSDALAEKLRETCDMAVKDRESTQEKLTDTLAILEKDKAKSNAAKRRVESIRKDMGKMLRVCSAKSLEDVEKMVRERREFQVQLTIAKADKCAAEDELAAYKDALRRQLVDNVKPSGGGVVSRLNRLRGKGKGNEEFTVADLQRLANNLMETLEERDARMKLKEMEKRELFDRIIELETRLQMVMEETEESVRNRDDNAELIEGRSRANTDDVESSWKERQSSNVKTLESSMDAKPGSDDGTPSQGCVVDQAN